MPIRKCKFTPTPFGLEPRLLAEIINPASGDVTRGRLNVMIDTAAAFCTIPGDYAKNLGYDIYDGRPEIRTVGNGTVTALST